MFLPALIACVSPSVSDDPSDAVRVGAVLPFTGEQAAVGPNIERMLLMVQEEVNDAGGIAGLPLVIEIRDTHSDVAEGSASAARVLAEHDVVAWLGPEESDLAIALGPLLGDAGVVWIVPGVGAPGPRDLDPDPLRVHIGPSAPVVAGALAGRIRNGDIDDLGILSSGDPYTAALGALLGCEFLLAGGSAVTTLGPGQLPELLLADPDAIALLTYARTGAEVVGDWSSLHPDHTHWYLSPTLDTDEFVLNVPPGALDDAVGIEPQVEWYAAELSGTFEGRWGDFPIRTAYYYYDAVAVLALAIARARHDAEGEPTSQQIVDAMVTVSGAPGTEVGWDGIADGLRLASDGEDVDYVGLTGPVDIGDGWVSQSLLGFWEVVDGQILHSALPQDYARFESSTCAEAGWF